MSFGATPERCDPPQDGKFWSFRDQCRLRDMIYRRVSLDEIAMELGRTRGGVRSKAYDLGVSFREVRKYFRPSSDRPSRLSDAERIALFAGIPLELANIVVSECAKRLIPLHNLRGESRSPRLVKCRRYISIAAKQRGYTLSEIGKALNRDHSTIRHHVLSTNSPGRKNFGDLSNLTPFDSDSTGA